ncbi:MAG: helix-turn-helix transcriptional regulator [Magnetococcales bacterium]|nr:helix-turn-helix transcriptional regulator [Magnetococcales bacterium]
MKEQIVEDLYGTKERAREQPDHLPRLESFAERVKTMLGHESLRSFAERSGLSVTVLRQYLSGNSDPTRTKLIAMANASNVNVLWLATGEGPMRRNDSGPNKPSEKQLDGYPDVGALEVLDAVEVIIELLDGLTLTPDHMRDAVRLCCEILSDESKKTNDAEKARKAGKERMQRILRLAYQKKS